MRQRKKKTQISKIKDKKGDINKIAKEIEVIIMDFL
jgi:hypothetical protein